MEEMVVDSRASVLVGGNGVEKQADHDVQLRLLVLGGMTMTGLIAWMKPGIVAEQCRAWVFLLLNLLLLAVVFISSKNEGHLDGNTGCSKKEAKKITSAAEQRNCHSDKGMESDGYSRFEKEWKQEKSKYDGPEITDCGKDEEDELNERVEAFIMMFKKHLIADAKFTSRGQTVQ